MAEKADYIVVRTAAGAAYATAGLPETALSQLLEHPETLLWRHLDRPVKLSHETLMVEAELPLLGGPVRAAYKQFRPRDWWKTISGRFRTSRAMRGWTLGRALLALGIATPRPLAACEPRRGTPPGATYLATEWIPRRKPAPVRLAAGQVAHRAAIAAGLPLCGKRGPAAGKNARRRGRPPRPQGGQSRRRRRARTTSPCIWSTWTACVWGFVRAAPPGDGLGPVGCRPGRPPLGDAGDLSPISAGLHRGIPVGIARLEVFLAGHRPPGQRACAAAAAAGAADALGQRN